MPVQSIAPFKLRGKEPKNALADAEAELSILISDNSSTWNI